MIVANHSKKILARYSSDGEDSFDLAAPAVGSLGGAEVRPPSAVYFVTLQRLHARAGNGPVAA
jgi:hypothetical protein